MRQASASEAESIVRRPSGNSAYLILSGTFDFTGSRFTVKQCWFCKSEVRTLNLMGETAREEAIQVECPVCLPYKIFGVSYVSPVVKRLNEVERGVMSHWLRKSPRPNLELPCLSIDFMQRLVPTLVLPSPVEQASNFVREIGDKLRGADPSQVVTRNTREWAACIGAVSADGFFYVSEELLESGILHRAGATGDIYSVGLTFKGWDRYEELQKAHSEGKIAFMAMDFKEETIALVYRDYFKPGVSQTGFDLRTINEKPQAGLIDPRLRVEIRKSRFLVADLTHHNNGAYWEAGFAEGLGKPVIYTCEKSVFEKKTTHFDTNHCHTVIWTETDPAAAREELKDTIRSTLPPGEALMSDPAPVDTK